MGPEGNDARPRRRSAQQHSGAPSRANNAVPRHFGRIPSRLVASPPVDDPRDPRALAVDPVRSTGPRLVVRPARPADADAIEQALTAHGRKLPPPPSNPMSADRVRWEHIQRVLGEHEGNISATARALGMHRRTLQRKLQKRP
eukprot:gene40998-biopygen32805